MKTSILYIIIASFLFTTLALTLQYKHLLLSLFCLEAMMLTMVLFLPISSSMVQINTPHSIMIMLTMGACEASLGLSLMVTMARSHGSDMLNTLNIMKC